MSIDSPVAIFYEPVIGASGRSAAFPCTPGDDITLEMAVSNVASDHSALHMRVLWSEDGRTFAQAGEKPDEFDDVSDVHTHSKTFTAKGSFFRFSWVAEGQDATFAVRIVQSMPSTVKSAENGTPLDAGAEGSAVATMGDPVATGDPDGVQVSPIDEPAPAPADDPHPLAEGEPEPESVPNA